MHNQLREIAKALREKAAAADAEKQVKCAQIIQAAVGINLLRRKIGC